MAVFGRIRRRLALAIVLTALIPVIVAVLLAESMIRKTSARFFVPEIGVRLDQSLELYQELARTVKTAMRYEADLIAARPSLRDATARADADAVQRELNGLLERYPDLVSLSVRVAEGKLLGNATRGRPLDPATENRLEVVRPLTASTLREESDEETLAPAGPELVAVFAADRARFEQLDEMSQFVDMYRKIEERRKLDESSYVYAFAALLGITILAAVGVGTLLARGVSTRIAELARATQRVATGDLTTRVPEEGTDELADLARAFNRMVGEVETNRARVEYLQRMATWQEMARRLAHEIKNPLTPIQLAVQEIHGRYPGADPKYQKLLDSTREMVEDEVGTLRRLVTEFSAFARLPQAELKPADLAEFLREQSELPLLVEEELADSQELLPAAKRNTRLEWQLPDGPAPAYLDRQMLKLALVNLVRNAAQASEQKPGARIRITLTRQHDHLVVDVDDNGPGIPSAMQESVFDPYVTTRAAGTGLGLAIVKKIVVEHGGSVSALSSPLGGARLRLSLPVAGTAAGRAAFEARGSGIQPSLSDGPPPARLNS